MQRQFAKDYSAAKKSPADRAALAVKLVKIAQETKDDDGVRYVLYSEARDLACQAGEWDMASGILANLRQEFAVDDLAQREAALQLLLKGALPKDVAEDAARAALAPLAECLPADRVDLAQRFV